MTPDDFKLLADLLKERSGLALNEDKTYLLESRLAPVARKHGLTGLDDLVGEIRSKRPEGLIHAVTEAMTTNESFFFRDTTPFDVFEKVVMPEFLQSRAGAKRLRIWSAACSTGQEPYSLAMVLKEMAAKLADWRIEIVGTDISGEVLEKAKVGIYSQFEVQRGLPIQLLMKYFAQVNELWQVDAALRAMVSYREFNLLKDLKPLGKFDVVFCRNVLIYFDQATKAQVLKGISEILTDDGCLFMGAAETVLGITDTFKPVPGQRGVYAKTGAPEAAPRPLPAAAAASAVPRPAAVATAT
ncbi:MAG: protein-glutamate O-methyltransferase [Alphaproteobacteria bacterium]|jgi:chemotaxis protein methyltransferase CheR|nr:protein-glutamate O-methyltransferase [Alphaproteobacteria bacterium]MDP6567201.1 protein-glutamate O-methyltransferase [Alphaproteobacteria bacterium]MDP6813476.1 protein-glutamate O-methyltransferase [Alphaproteobacteria bacterium]